MNRLIFDRPLLSNLELSLEKELIFSNNSGATCAVTLIGCNARRTHGLLSLPVEAFGYVPHLLLASVQEEVIQHGVSFRLGVQRYAPGVYFPSGHRYIRRFELDSVARCIYRVGGVILVKEWLLSAREPRVMLRYTLHEAHSPTVLRLRPFLAFRPQDALTRENSAVDVSYHTVPGGLKMRLYEGFPELYMQFSKRVKYHHEPVWWRQIEYHTEHTQRSDGPEDQLVPGCFEVAIRQGESIVFAASVAASSPPKLKKLWDDEQQAGVFCGDMHSCLRRAAGQFLYRQGAKLYLLSGHPCGQVRARDAFVSLAGCTLFAGNPGAFHQIAATACGHIEGFMRHGRCEPPLKNLDENDVFLWFVRAIQQYAEYESLAQAAEKYGGIVLEIVEYILQNRHPSLFFHSNGLLYTDGDRVPNTWMNDVKDAQPVTPRCGYVVEINALWYNALCFASELSSALNDPTGSRLFDYRAQTTREAFAQTFWNGSYLFDYVNGSMRDREVRPNMIFAVGLPHSPLSKAQQKAVLDITTRELLTPKGLRTLSPKSGAYRPFYLAKDPGATHNRHNGPVWTWLMGAYVEAYLKLYRRSGRSFVERFVGGMESEISELCVGTLSELYDGNPPFRGHGAVSFAMNVAEMLRIMHILGATEKQER